MLDYPGPAAAWLDALTRADHDFIRVWQLHTDGPDYQVWESTSSEEPALPVYTIAVQADRFGIRISCDCDGGTNGRICKHAAKVLQVMGHLAKPDAEPTPIPRRRTVNLGNRELSGRECLAILNGEDV